MGLTSGRDWRFPGKFLTGPRLGVRKRVWLGINYGPQLGESEVFLVGKHEREALGEMDGDVVWWSKGGCLSVKRKGPGLGNVWNGCEVGSLDVQLLRGPKTKVVR